MDPPPATSSTSQGFLLQTAGMDSGSPTKERNLLYRYAAASQNSQEGWRTKLRKKIKIKHKQPRTRSESCRREPGRSQALLALGPHPATTPSVVLPLCSSSYQIQGWARISNQPSARCSCPRCQGEGRSGDWRETLKWQENILCRLISCLLGSNPTSLDSLKGSQWFSK